MPISRPNNGAPVWISLAAAILLVGGCTQTANLSGGGAPPQTAGQATAATSSVFPDIPIPEGAKMIVDRTLVVGTEEWFGQLALSAPSGAAEMFDYYRTRLPQFGWQEITSVRAPVSVLTYERDSRILQMQIKGSTLTGSDITITVSPRGTPGAGAPTTTIN